MAKIFDINNGEVVLTPESLAIPAFKDIWDADKSTTKLKAKNEVKYVVFLCDAVTSPYKDYPYHERVETLKEDIFKDPEWKPSNLVEEAIKTYSALTETTSTRLLQSAKIATEKLAKYFEEVDFTKVDNYGKPMYSARDLSSNLSAVGNIVKSLNTLENAVRKEQLDGSRTRGGSDINYFEDADNF